MPTNYERGRAYEYRVKAEREKQGWTVLRTAGSHGEFDLVAIRRKADMNEIRLIQCKSGKSAKRERAKLESLKAKYDGTYDVRVEVV